MQAKSMKEWVTVQDCIGIPGFPVGAANVRKKLELLSTGNPSSRRKRDGIKGWEYSVSILPDIARKYFGDDNTNTIIASAPERNENLSEDDSKFWWEAIYKALSKHERSQVVSAFKNQGKAGVFAEHIMSSAEIDISTISHSTLKTAQVLEALPDSERKEILARYGITEQSGPVAPYQAPHKTRQSHKKAG